jgi:hypothetical protein
MFASLNPQIPKELKSVPFVVSKMLQCPNYFFRMHHSKLSERQKIVTTILRLLVIECRYVYHLSYRRTASELLYGPMGHYIRRLQYANMWRDSANRILRRLESLPASIKSCIYIDSEHYSSVLSSLKLESFPLSEKKDIRQFIDGNIPESIRKRKEKYSFSKLFR